MLVRLVLQIFEGPILLRLPREPPEPDSQCVGCVHYQGKSLCSEFRSLPSMFWSNAMICTEHQPR
jgi:hypothetical protein